jgi:ubiquinone/menaquinone biosynthesis C-methylase UbiE
LPFADSSFDTAVVTWSLCSIAAPDEALREIHRVLRPGAQLLFVEHGLSPERHVAAWQRRLTPVWRRLAGNCHLDRKPDELIRQAGFAIDRIGTGYAKGPRPMTFFYEGSAMKA